MMIIAFAATSVSALAQPSGQSSAFSYPHSITPLEAKAKIDRGLAVLIDVREREEILNGMAGPAHWYAKSSIDSDEAAFMTFLGGFPGKEIILYCHSGKRASLVIEKLAKRDIPARNMGGYSDWVAAGLPSKAPTPLGLIFKDSEPDYREEMHRAKIKYSLVKDALPSLH